MSESRYTGSGPQGGGLNTNQKKINTTTFALEILRLLDRWTHWNRAEVVWCDVLYFYFTFDCCFLAVQNVLPCCNVRLGRAKGANKTHNAFVSAGKE